MIKRFRYILIAVAMMLGGGYVAARSSQSSIPVVELLGDNYYVYTVKSGDTLFGIARSQGWDDKTLAKLNPSAIGPLEKGMKIYYPAPKQNSGESKDEAIPTELQEVKHKVKRGETVYSISNMYGVPVETLYTLNPTSRNGIKAGETLLIRGSQPVAGRSNEKTTVIYTVRSGDTLSALARTYGVSVAAIMQSNPGVDEHNFRVGSNIKIPQRGTGINTTVKTVEETNLDSVELRKVGKKDTWSSIASQNGVSEQMLREANPGVSELKNKQYIGVPKVETVTEEREVALPDPRESSEEGIASIYDDVHNIASDEQQYTVRVAVVVDDVNSNRDIEFLRGFLTGIDRQKRAGYRIEMKVVNTADGSQVAVNELETFKPTIVFLTTDTEIPKYMAEYARNSRTPVVNTFDVKSSSYTDNPYIIQLLTPPALFNDNIAHDTHLRYGDRTLLFVGGVDADDQLAEALTRVWDKSKVRTLSEESVVPEYFAEDGKYLVYVCAVKKNEVSEVLGKVATVRAERPLADISVLGRPNLIVYEESLAEVFKNANVTVPSRFYIDKESAPNREFMQRYKMLFDRTPVKSLPLYAATGYDTACYFLPALAEARGDYNKLGASVNTVQSDFDLVRPTNWSGFLNPPVYMLEFTSIGTVEKRVIDYTE